MLRTKPVVTLALGLLLTAGLIGCATDAQTGALVGGVGGAAIGQAVGGDTGSTLIGAGVGGAVGYGVGNESDKAKAAQEREELRQMSSTHVVYVTNSNGSQKPITLYRRGGRWVGPKGEEYTSIPTEATLRPMYAD